MCFSVEAKVTQFASCTFRSLVSGFQSKGLGEGSCLALLFHLLCYINEIIILSLSFSFVPPWSRTRDLNLFLLECDARASWAVSC